MLRIPTNFTISKFSAAGTPLAGLLESVAGVLPDKAVTALVLLHYSFVESAAAASADSSGDNGGGDGGDSWQAQYVGFLPRYLTNLLYFTPSELAELQCPVRKSVALPACGPERWGEVVNCDWRSESRELGCRRSPCVCRRRCRWWRRPSRAFMYRLYCD
jgi:hypothetical protein